MKSNNCNFPKILFKVCKSSISLKYLLIMPLLLLLCLSISMSRVNRTLTLALKRSTKTVSNSLVLGLSRAISSSIKGVWFNNCLITYLQKDRSIQWCLSYKYKKITFRNASKYFATLKISPKRYQLSMKSLTALKSNREVMIFILDQMSEKYI